MQIVGLDPDPGFATAIAAELGVTVAAHEDRRFEDGEHKTRPLVDPRGADVYVVQGLHGAPADSPHDALCRLLFFIATLRDHGAARVTAVVPYVAYARKDRRTKPFDPVTGRYVAQLFEAVGVDQLMVLEAHNPAGFENAFRCVTHHLEAHPLFDAVADEEAAQGPVAVASPDPGGVKRAQLWRESLEQRLGRPVGFAMVDKRRSAGVVSGGTLVAGDVDGATVLLVDDLIATGGTLRRAATALREAGAVRVVACAAHGLFIDPAPRELADDALAAVVVTDSVPPFRVPRDGSLRAKLRVVSAAPAFARLIADSHRSWMR